MAGEIYEWYGYRVNDKSATAAEAAEFRMCPFVPGGCTKTGGVCSVKTSADDVIAVCPKRMYFGDHFFAREIASEAFARLDVSLEEDGLPALVPGDTAHAVAAAHGENQVGLFGGSGWAGEIKLPPLTEGGSRYSVDYTLVAVSPEREILGFVPIEVQSIDTTGNYRASLTALENGRQVAPSGFSLNFENVNKRILPQLITKGLILQGERYCTTGIYFVTPEPVYQRLMQRLGGLGRFRQVPQQPGSITFVRFQPSTSGYSPGSPEPLVRLPNVTISTSDMSLAFISPSNLPLANSYEAEIARRL